ncbi:MAG: terminase large subunit [Minisyncoccia bacterium]
MELHPAQKQIVSDQHRFRILVCGRKFGKTTLAAEEITGCAFSKANRRIMYLSPTLEDSRRLMWDRLNQKLKGVIIKSNDTRLELKIKTQDGGTSDIFLSSWEKVQDHRGDEFDFIIPDETQDYREFWLGWHEALRPTLTPRKGSALFMGTPKGFNHLYDLFGLEAKDSDYKSFHFTSYDNPYLDPEEIEKAKKELTEDRFAQEYLADFRKTEGLVYKEFNRELHLYDKCEARIVEKIGGIDFGFTNPAAILTILRDSDENFWVDSEFYKTQQTEPQIVEYVTAQRFNKVYPDPEAPSAIAALTKAKVNIREVIKNKDSVKNGIDRVRELFKANRLHINRSCINLIWELETYAYPDKRDLRNPDENPIKENDHAVDALRYPFLMLTEYKKQAEQYKPANMDRTAIPTLHRERPTQAKQFIPNNLRPR